VNRLTGRRQKLCFPGGTNDRDPATLGSALKAEHYRRREHIMRVTSALRFAASPVRRRRWSQLWPMSWAAGIAAIFFDVFIESPLSSGNRALAVWVAGTLVFPGALTLIQSLRKRG